LSSSFGILGASADLAYAINPQTIKKTIKVSINNLFFILSLPGRMAPFL
jgi:hypothetical protein